jgi:hypothetical protein
MPSSRRPSPISSLRSASRSREVMRNDGATGPLKSPGCSQRRARLALAPRRRRGDDRRTRSPIHLDQKQQRSSVHLRRRGRTIDR